ncbi:hypothetical protein [Mycolicibacterium senegalense]|uniref:Uncharacterized protein n=1 Tax=Mycolicibacterium senegalense TaxID=1796 RepID=A0ABR5G1V0_9MYCO|nr:hypothetical protein [Mycolicibacterium senegalense]KLI05785.1 hypothetical protein AA982_22765 [Mycolicibacterium senegalense]KLO54069.1 hypothetical protein ABW05_23935 [Mycolicibacterium senegalense]KLO54136.1 hypothetical protein ABW05_24370 [Mycolicibacterium senegalense]
MTAPLGTEVSLGFTVWPVWVGLCEDVLGLPVEPLANLEYRRGQIFWRNDHGQIIGAGRVFVPGGIPFHRIVYAHTPAGEPCGYAPLPQALLYRTATFVDIDPITNTDTL